MTVIVLVVVVETAGAAEARPAATKMAKRNENRMFVQTDRLNKRYGWEIVSRVDAKTRDGTRDGARV